MDNSTMPGAMQRWKVHRAGRGIFLDMPEQTSAVKVERLPKGPGKACLCLPAGAIISCPWGHLSAPASRFRAKELREGTERHRAALHYGYNPAVPAQQESQNVHRNTLPGEPPGKRAYRWSRLPGCLRTREGYI